MRSTEHTGHLEFLVGAVALCGVAMLVFLGLGASGLLALKTVPYPLHARFEHIGGLRPQAPVKAAGVVVGRVSAIGYDTAHGVALVDMAIDPRYRFPADTRASIRTSGLLGEQHIALSPGGDVRLLAGDDTVSRTQSALVLEDLIGRLLYDKAQAH
ncbi:outer membrane lipid asymmetry maintenance protein MlaD [Niveibacterium sp.]|uniref:outer membrane lipid asymmetry maintenance protein MlaD n=1 Tax=Niveibacterium sp. TaxID=2017444 RepID=UPI0035AE06E9